MLEAGIDGDVAALDRERAVRGALEREPNWSDRRVAEVCGVSPKTVARVRSHLAPACDAEGAKRVGRDGRARPVRPAEVRKAVAEAVRQHPSASLRSIASRLNVSPETVRSVRRSLGTEPGLRPPAVAPVSAPAFLSRHRPPAAAPWRQDRAFASVDDGVDFVAWFEATDLKESTWERCAQVPLSRVYEIADEARRRAAWWLDLADTLEARTRRRTSA